MTGLFWWNLAIGVAAALVLAWVALAIALAALRPRGGLLREAVRILPDTLRLIRRLAADKTMPPRRSTATSTVVGLSGDTD
jgi:hypothetical protein